ncbi:CocE/NonD family hydrolase [Allonocardiopsis opalescens]|uniref:Putative CocE/NonD family hydrolase n=1 Tax=Allonocardiopsis opalescens TaxID=1144618 RepID=A0A2T0Q223_9ACTN|nr:CocE/NonD family hydrolase [Allonocardiopsis opalescens]PRX97760.1 putative CocE/NonD family hydrolase [Allonocardiopsis opalescens]
MTPPSVTEHLVTAHDGVRLAATVVRPTAGRTGPAVVIRTPYGRRSHLAEAHGWARHGFTCVVGDVRGRFDSGGAFLPYANEPADGAAVLDWLAGQNCHDGRVVLAGASYAAYCAVAAALTAPAGVRGVLAAVPALGPGETAREPGGAARLACRVGWWTEHGGTRRPRIGVAADEELLAELPVVELPERVLGAAPPGWRELWSAPRRGALWAGLAGIGVPLLAIGGTDDPFAADTLELARRWGGPRRLVLGPWGHELDTRRPGAALGGRRLGSLYAAWARAVCGEGVSGDRAAIATAPNGAWRTFTHPVPARSVPLTPLPAETAQTDAPSGDAHRTDGRTINAAPAREPWEHLASPEPTDRSQAGAVVTRAADHARRTPADMRAHGLQTRPTPVGEALEHRSSKHPDPPGSADPTHISEPTTRSADATHQMSEDIQAHDVSAGPAPLHGVPERDPDERTFPPASTTHPNVGAPATRPADAANKADVDRPVHDVPAPQVLPDGEPAGSAHQPSVDTRADPVLPLRPPVDGSPAAAGAVGGRPHAARSDESAGVHFVADPRRPFRSDADGLARRGSGDHVVLVTGPLPAGELRGAAAVRLRVRADTVDADWFALLSLLTAAGSRPLGRGIVRRTHRPGRAEELTVTTAPIGAGVPEGARLAVTVAGHHWPYHARNPHTGVDAAHARELLPGRREVLDGTLELPWYRPDTDVLTADELVKAFPC